MGGRIITLQRQARELGRLRAGYSEPNRDDPDKRDPKRSKNWIITSHSEDYVRAAAELWGGQVEPWAPQGNGAPQYRVMTNTDTIDAILPPGDPLSQTYEMWSRGGCQRRCNGETEQKSGKPCVCLATYGEEWFTRSPKQVCRPHSRLSVILPDLPDLGVWRVETQGFYAANEMAAAIDLIRHATGGSVMVPVRLRIEPRTQVADGKTKQFPVIVVEIRGATAGQLLSGSIQPAALDAPEQRQAITSGPGKGNGKPTATAEELRKQIPQATTKEDLAVIWEAARQAGIKDDRLRAEWMARSAAIKAAAEAPATSQPAGDAGTETEPNPDEMFNLIVAAAPDDWSTSELRDRIAQFLEGKSADSANGWELGLFYDALRGGSLTGGAR